VRGTEDLGGGLQAFFQLETAFKPDQNDTAFATRNSGVGLQGGWGSFVIGRWDTPYKVSTYPVDAFGDLTMAGISGLGHDQGNFDRRDQNMIQYWSPNFAGFAFKAMYQVNEAKTATTNPHDTSANVTYTAGPIYAFPRVRGPQGSVRHGEEGKGLERRGRVHLRPDQDRRRVRGDQAERRHGSGSHEAQGMAREHRLHDREQPAHLSAPGLEGRRLQERHHRVQVHLLEADVFIAEYMRTDNSDQSTCSFATTATFPVSKGVDVRAAAVGIQHVF
jgi:Outer membrane protein (porin)